MKARIFYEGKEIKNLLRTSITSFGQVYSFYIVDENDKPVDITSYTVSLSITQLDSFHDTLFIRDCTKSLTTNNLAIFTTINTDFAVESSYNAELILAKTGEKQILQLGYLEVFEK